MNFWEFLSTCMGLSDPTGGRVKFFHGRCEFFHGENGIIGFSGGENFFLGSCRVTDERRDFPTGNDGHLAKGPRTFGF